MKERVELITYAVFVLERSLDDAADSGSGPLHLIDPCSHLTSSTSLPTRTCLHVHKGHNASLVALDDLCRWVKSLPFSRQYYTCSRSLIIYYKPSAPPRRDLHPQNS